MHQAWAKAWRLEGERLAYPSTEKAASSQTKGEGEGNKAGPQGGGRGNWAGHPPSHAGPLRFFQHQSLWCLLAFIHALLSTSHALSHPCPPVKFLLTVQDSAMALAPLQKHPRYPPILLRPHAESEIPAFGSHGLAPLVDMFMDSYL